MVEIGVSEVAVLMLRNFDFAGELIEFEEFEEDEDESGIEVGVGECQSAVVEFGKWVGVEDEFEE